jgi:hypothetical protein
VPSGKNCCAEARTVFDTLAHSDRRRGDRSDPGPHVLLDRHHARTDPNGVPLVVEAHAAIFAVWISLWAAPWKPRTPTTGMTASRCLCRDRRLKTGQFKPRSTEVNWHPTT